MWTRGLVLGLGLVVMPASQASLQGLDLGVWPSLGASVATTYMAGPMMIPLPSGGTRTTTTYYGLAPATPNVANISATETQVQTPVATNVSVTGLNAVASAGTSGAYWTVTVRDATVNTAVHCQLGPSAGTYISCTDNYGTTSDFANINAGDLVDVAVVNSGTMTASNFSMSFMMRSRDGQSLPLFFGTAAAIALTNTTGFNFWQGQLASVVLPVNGHIDNLYVQASGAVGVTTPPTGATFTVLYGPCGSEVATSPPLQVSMTSAVSSGNDTNAAHGFDAVAGNCIVLQEIGGTGGASVFVNGSVRWTAGAGFNYYYPVFGVGTTLLTTSTAGRYCASSNIVSCQTSAYQANFPDTQTYNAAASSGELRNATAQTLYVWSNTGPATANRTWDVVGGAGGAGGQPSCTQSGSTSPTTCTGSTSSALAPGTSYNVYTAPAATGTTSPATYRFSYGVTVE